MKKWMLILGTCGTLAGAGSGVAGNSSNYCAWDNNTPAICTEVKVQENEGLSGIVETTIDVSDETVVTEEAAPVVEVVAAEDEIVIDMGDTEAEMEF